MDCKIVKKEAFSVLEKVEPFTTENGENLRKITEFWTRAHKDGTMDTLLKQAKNDYAFGICYGKGVFFDYSIAVQCAETCVAPEGYRVNRIPAYTWAVFTCKGAMPTAIQNAWREIMTEYFPTSAYMPTGEIEIEAYPDGDTDSEEYISEIWIPVEKKA